VDAFIILCSWTGDPVLNFGTGENSPGSFGLRRTAHRQLCCKKETGEQIGDGWSKGGRATSEFERFADGERK
jgi:hypothetical protein